MTAQPVNRRKKRWLVVILVGVVGCSTSCFWAWYSAVHCDFPRPVPSGRIEFSERPIDVQSASQLVQLGAIRGNERTNVVFSPDDGFLVSLGPAYSHWGRDLGAEAPSHCSVTWVIDVSGVTLSQIRVNNSGIDTNRVWPSSAPNFSHGGDLVLINNAQRQIIDLQTGHEVARLSFQDDGAFPPLINRLSFSPDNQWIAAINDHRILVWDANTTRLSFIMTGHSDTIRFLDFSRQLISASDDGTVRSWNLEARTNVIIYEGVPQSIRSFDISINGDIAVSFPDRAIAIDEVSGAVRMELMPGTLQFSPNGRYVLSWSLREWWIWNVETQDLLSHVSTDNSISSVVYDPTSELVAVVSSDGILELYTVAGELLSTYRVLVEGEITDVAFNHAGTLLVFAWRSEIEQWPSYPDDVLRHGGIELWGVR